MHSTGRVFVADRVNSRIQIFDPDGKFLTEWKQFGRPSAVFIDKNDVIYVADSQTEDRDGCTPDPGCHRGADLSGAHPARAGSHENSKRGLKRRTTAAAVALVDHFTH